MAKKSSSPSKVKRYAIQPARTKANKERNIARQKKFEEKCRLKKAKTTNK